MANINDLRKKLEDLKNKKSGNKNSSKINYWTPEVGKYSVRILVPLDDPNEVGIVEQAVHYDIGGKQFTCNKLTPSIGKDCPICAKAREFWDLYNESRNEGLGKEELEEVRKAASSYTANKRYYVPIYVKETQEVCMWSLSEKNYEKILNIITTDEVEGFLEPANGHDIKVDYTQEQPGNRRTATWTFTPSMKKTPTVGGKELDEEAYQELFDKIPVIDITESDMLEMEKALDENGEELAAEVAADSSEEEEEVVVEKPKAPAKPKTSKLHSVLSDLKSEDDDEF